MRGAIMPSNPPKYKTSAALRSGTKPDKAWTEQDLTESGRFVFSRFGAQ